MNGASVIHRTGVNYPPAALQAGVQGTVQVQVKLDSTGVVNDAQVLSGPDELRKAVLESVLQWHFTREVAGTTRVIQIAFEVPKPGETHPVPGGLLGPTAVPPGIGTMRAVQLYATAAGGPQGPSRITSIQVVGLSEQATTELLASLPVHEGDEWNADAMQKANQALKAFDEHLTVQTSRIVQSASGNTEVFLRIAAVNAQTVSPAGAAGRIKVGGNVEGAMIVNKVPPVYPAAAKEAGVSGVVHLAAIIGKDGRVQELHALSGPPLLIQAAIDAVRQWVYRPTLLNGNPVEVETTIDINFTLNQ
jgi:protein TonB